MVRIREGMCLCARIVDYINFMIKLQNFKTKNINVSIINDNLYMITFLIHAGKKFDKKTFDLHFHMHAAANLLLF